MSGPRIITHDIVKKFIEIDRWNDINPAGFGLFPSIDRDAKPESVEGSQDKTYLRPRLALFHFHDPLAADFVPLGKFPLIQAKFTPPLTDDEADVNRVADQHG